MDNIEITFNLTQTQAMALAQFCKRIGYQDFRLNAENEIETNEMIDAHGELYAALQHKGFNPR